ncbi:hypothetical protein [Tsukamurella sp. NPDC003166]|uniref:hypothetical protein n=1 Tax=Tsukamurella sp. NPDC003166 TaxID=3154444 RepID=UPI0033BF178C
MATVRIGAVAAASSVAITLIVAPSASAATISGTNTCIHHATRARTAPVGIWVEPIGGGSPGWAVNTRRATYSDFSFTANGATRFVLRTGCGGTPQNWASSITSPPVNGIGTTITNTW